MADAKAISFNLNCPVPRVADDRIVLAHGGGGRLTHQLIEKIFLPAFSNAALEQRHDGAVVSVNGARLAFTTDSFVVRPLIFPGGNIGDLAVNGTVNDLAMCGARPLYLSAGFILEEGLEMETLRTVVSSMKEAAAKANVRLVTGDTKVVDKGKGDGIFINTSGIGVIESRTDRANGFERARLQPRRQEPTETRALAAEVPTIGPAAVQPGDVVIVSGDLGRHGIAILSVREGLEFESPILSDCANLWPAVEALLNAGIEIHCLRDLTRGGLATTLNEIASDRNICVKLEETLIPVEEIVQSACEILGLDPLYVANEGRFAVFVPATQADAALSVLKKVEVSQASVRVGTVEESPGRTVVLQSRIGGNRVVDMLSGEQLPRIC
ncbi:MAG TPA: hydrogenase expression/formation protein HypE [Candidatus Dormibacteraeota bacterium]|nr:hydrogenase expression/formation protein HypE [Candidatus Dormibacteraeota bacterium]